LLRDFEKHRQFRKIMKPEETAAGYDRLAPHWAGADFNGHNGIAQHERAMRFARKGGVAVDVGCGSSGRIIEFLLGHGYEVEGLDISPEMLALARVKHPAVRFHQGDVSVWEFPRQYDFISAWDSIWHVPLDRHEAVLEKLCAALAPGGVMIFTTGAMDVPGEVTNPFKGQPLYHAALGIPQLLRLVDRFGCVCRHLEHDEPDGPHVFLVVEKR
jgi:SAM-dependent methyltransferase